MIRLLHCFYLKFYEREIEAVHHMSFCQVTLKVHVHVPELEPDTLRSDFFLSQIVLFEQVVSDVMI